MLTANPAGTIAARPLTGTPRYWQKARTGLLRLRAGADDGEPNRTCDVAHAPTSSAIGIHQRPIRFNTNDAGGDRIGRSEERRVGKEADSTGRSRWQPLTQKKKTLKKHVRRSSRKRQ